MKHMQVLVFFLTAKTVDCAYLSTFHFISLVDLT